MAGSIETTTTVNTTTTTRDGTQMVVSSQSNTISLGDYVTGVTLQPYMASRIISFFAYNMRPNHRMHVFFDSVLVDQYCAPGTLPVTPPVNTSDPNSVTRTGTWGDAIYSDSTGVVVGQFLVPEGKFKTGDRMLQITDVSSLAQGNDAITSISSASFTASNLNVTKQTATLTTVNPVINYVPVSNTVISTNTTITTKVIQPVVVNINEWHHEPIAQGLTINTPGTEAGIFASSIDIFFKQKSLLSYHGVTLYLTEIDNGYPNGLQILPFSLVHLTNAQINVSDDGTVATNFKFESPVFLSDQKEYAFVVKPDSNDPDFFVFSAGLGDIDLSSGIQVFSQPAVGTAFFGATDTQWSALQSEYIKFKLYRCDFSAGSGSATFTNGNTDYIAIYNVAYANNTADIRAGDYVYKAANSLANTTGSTIDGTTYGIIDFYDSTRRLIYVANSTGNFVGNSFVQIHRYANASVSTANQSTLVAYANTAVVYNPIVDALVPQFATMTPSGTGVNFSYKGTSNTYATDSSAMKVVSGYESEFYDRERLVVSRSNEVANMGSSKSLFLTADLYSDSSFLSPVIDTVKTSPLALRNLISPILSVYDEFYNSSVTPSKYVSQVITLADGQDAEDLQIMLTAFRPPSADIQVYVKFLNGEDTDPITQKTWTPMRNLGASLFSAPNNPNDKKEFVFAVPYQYTMLSTTGTVTAANTSANVVGVGTLFGNEIGTGWYVNMAANSTFNETSRKIISIANTTQLTLDAPFNGNYSGQKMYVVPPPTVAWLSTNNSVQLTGTVAANTSTNIITGTGTNFTGQLVPGAIINIANDSQTVISITNSTSLSVGTPWSSVVSGVNAYNVTPNGVTYLNKTNALFSSFKRFQIKIVLMSDDSSRVPQIDDLRALALQL